MFLVGIMFEYILVIMYLVELNVGWLLVLIDDLWVREFMDNFDWVNGFGKWMLGFVWMMEGFGELGIGNIENFIVDDFQFVVNLIVWEDLFSFEVFVFKIIYKQFFDCKVEWFEVYKVEYFVMWQVFEGY